MPVLAKVSIAPKPKPSAGYKPLRTAAQIKRANKIMVAGGGRWFIDGKETSYSSDIIWFHDGKLGWHLKKANPQPVTEFNWSQFEPDDMVKPSINYKEVASPFAKAKEPKGSKEECAPLLSSSESA